MIVDKNNYKVNDTVLFDHWLLALDPAPQEEDLNRNVLKENLVEFREDYHRMFPQHLAGFWTLIQGLFPIQLEAWNSALTSMSASASPTSGVSAKT